MFSAQHRFLCEQIAELAHTAAKPLGTLRYESACDFAPYLWAEEFGCGGTLDQTIAERAAELKRRLFSGRVFVIVPMYVTSVCREQCLYCNYRAGNTLGVARKRLTDDELRQEALYLIRGKGYRVLELVYSSDPQVRVDAMCRHVELLRNLLEQHGGGLVGLSGEALDESEYARLVNAGLCWAVLWQETYDKTRYAELHPGKMPKSHFEYRVDAYERMLSAGVPHVGMGVLSGLAAWKRDWTMLMMHEEFLKKNYGRAASILGTARLKFAPGAVLKESAFTPTRQEFVATIALHNLFSPDTAPFVSTREEWDLCVELSRGGGCLFTLSCSTIPGGYSLHHQGCQFSSGSYDAPIYVRKLADQGLKADFQWIAEDLRPALRAKAQA